jgi:hypothetical protein
MQDRRRNGTRVSCDIPAQLETLNSLHLPPAPCLIIVVNPQGCGVKFGRPLEIGTRVQVQGIIANRNVIARVVNCISLGEYEKFWFLGLALDEPGQCLGNRETARGLILTVRNPHVGFAVQVTFLPAMPPAHQHYWA